MFRFGLYKLEVRVQFALLYSTGEFEGFAACCTACAPCDVDPAGIEVGSHARDTVVEVGETLGGFGREELEGPEGRIAGES